MNNLRIIAFLCLLFPSISPGQSNKTPAKMETGKSYETATFGAGCFWCVEAIYLDLKGVIKVTSGYSGGSVENPTYKQVTSGTTGHAEVVQLVYDPSQVTYPELLEVFWKTHDPTTMNRQGADVGTQYRSVVFYHSPQQKELAETYKKRLNDSGAWDHPVITEISPYSAFYKAEDYHQNYFRLNPEAGYCKFVIQPKVEKFRKAFGEKVKK
jgi:peptide-methionine (S)-S-oxide reductase